MTATAPTQQDIQNLAWTMLGEANPGDTAGMTAVGNTVLNRLNHGGYGSTISRVVLAPNQYAAWGIGSQAAAQGNNPQGRFPVDSTQFQRAYGLAQQLVNGTVPDNTGGALNYRQTTPGTRWAAGAPGTVSIGGNTFQASHPVPPANVPTGVPAQAPNDMSAFDANVGSVANSTSALKAINAEVPPPLPIPRPSAQDPSIHRNSGVVGSNAGDNLAAAPLRSWYHNVAPPMDAGINPATGLPQTFQTYHAPPNTSGPPDERQMPWQPPTPIAPIAAPSNFAGRPSIISPNNAGGMPAIPATGMTIPPTTGSFPGLPSHPSPNNAGAPVPSTFAARPGIVSPNNVLPPNPSTFPGRPGIVAPNGTAPTPSLADSLYNFLQAPYNQSHMTQGVGPGTNPLTQAQKLAMIAPAPSAPSPTILSIGPNPAPSQSGLTEAQKLAMLKQPPNTIASGLTSGNITYTPRVPATVPQVSGQTSPIYGTPAAPAVNTPPLPRPRPASLDEILYPNGMPTRSWLDGLPPSPKQGQISVGGDGKNYQYVEGANGAPNWGWEQTTQAAPGGWDSNGVPSWVTGQNSPYTVTYPPAATADNPGTVLGGAVRQVPVSALQPLANGLSGLTGLIAPPHVSQPPTPSYSSGNGGQHIIPSPAPVYHAPPVSQTPPSASYHPSPASYTPPSAYSPNNYGVPGYSGNTSYGPSSYAAPPPLPIPRPAYVPPTITRQVLNPDYTQWQAQALPSSYPVTSGAGSGYGWATQNTGDPNNPFDSFASVANLPPPAARGPAPAQYIPQTVRNPALDRAAPSSTSQGGGYAAPAIIAPPPPPPSVQLASGSMAPVGQQFDAGSYRYQVNADGSTTNLMTGHTYGGSGGMQAPTLPNSSFATPAFGGDYGHAPGQIGQSPAAASPNWWTNLGTNIGNGLRTGFNGSPVGHAYNFVTGNSGASTGGGLLSLFGNHSAPAPGAPSQGGGLLSGMGGMFSSGNSSPGITNNPGSSPGAYSSSSAPSNSPAATMFSSNTLLPASMNNSRWLTGY